MLVKSKAIYEALIVSEENLDEAVEWGAHEPSAGTLVGKVIVRNQQMIVAILDLDVFHEQYEEFVENDQNGSNPDLPEEDTQPDVPWEEEETPPPTDP